MYHIHQECSPFFNYLLILSKAPISCLYIYIYEILNYFKFCLIHMKFILLAWENLSVFV